ncbi:F-box protein [Aspergillus puulaauensis]|uniref:F-box domain-containing protein n=1 Tax=Aspergillus puulaauensis TaxID=1220207 RepID=A0A7R8ANP5_9EURO|nr:uncharacterized protein APUU_41566S [Aspergillus puulaauensis]BCS25122.1 hypothetical protein APUU_41566S [Aspergillus puulaauensis]
MATSLPSLPTELLLIIFDHLPPATKHTFSLTCRRLNYILVPLCPSISIFPDTQYALRAALARDGIPFTTYAYCSGCETVHSHKFFTADQLQLSPTARVCSAAQTNLFIDPTTSYSFNHVSIRTSNYTIRAAESVPCNRPSLNIGLDERKIMRLKLKRPYNAKAKLMRQYSSWMRQHAICASYEVLTLPAGKNASKEQIRSGLNGFDIPTCPHVKLGDSVVVDGYRGMQYCVIGSSPASKRHALEEDDEDEWLSRIQTDDVDSACRFPGCVTVFRWGCRPSLHRGDGWKTVVIHVKRYLGAMISPLDPYWMAQLVTVSDDDMLRRYWEDCFAWRDVNLAIEERRYERELELELQGGTLGEADEAQFDLLRRENDYLRHPHRQEMYTYLHQRISMMQPEATGELPFTTLLLRDARRHRNPHIDTESEESVSKTDDYTPDKPQGENTRVSDKPANMIPNPNAADLYKPVHAPETIRALIQDSSKFNTLLLAPFQRNVEEFFWGSGDCLSNPGGVFGMLKALKVPLVDQLYSLPRGG